MVSQVAAKLKMSILLIYGRGNRQINKNESETISLTSTVQIHRFCFDLQDGFHESLLLELFVWIYDFNAIVSKPLVIIWFKHIDFYADMRAVQAGIYRWLDQVLVRNKEVRQTSWIVLSIFVISVSYVIAVPTKIKSLTYLS